MSWKTLCNDWIPTALALVLCLGAYGLYRGAWYVGYEANAIGLLGWHFLRFLLLLIAWITIVSTFKAVTGKERPPGRINVVEGASAISIFLGCMGCYPVWPLVLLLAALLFVVALFSPNGLTRGSVSGLAYGRMVMATAFFVLTWYLCASTTRQALRGLGDRIEAKVGSDRFVAWATAQIDACKRQEEALPGVGASAVGLMTSPHGQGPFLAYATLVAGGAAEHPWELRRDETPDWMDDLLGPFQGVRSVMVEEYGYGRCVTLRTGGSGFHFRISVCPTRVRQDPPPWWLGEVGGLERHGIFLETEGK